MKYQEADKSFFDIDLNKLEEECANHSLLVHEYSVAHAEAKTELDELTAEKDVVIAELSKAIRDDPAKYGMEKFTETGLKSLLPLQKGLKRISERIIKKRHEVDLLAGVNRALEHRKRMLTNCVELHGQQYFDTPHVKTQATKENIRKERKKRVRRKGKQK